MFTGRIHDFVASHRTAPRAIARSSRGSLFVADTITFCSMLFPVAFAQSALAPTEPVRPTLHETLQWLTNTLKEIQESDLEDNPEFSRWGITTVEGCSIAIRETIYSNGHVRLVTDWAVPLNDISAEYLRDQIRREETSPDYPSDMKVKLKLHHGRAFKGLPEQKAGVDTTPTPEVVMTRELALSLPAGKQEVEIEKALLHAAVACGADSPRLE